MTRILYIGPTRIGDALLSSGVLAHVLDAHPDARVTVAAGPGAADLFRAAPGVERVHVMRKRKGGGHWFDLWKAVVGVRWDLVVDLRRSLTGYALRAKRRIVAPKTDFAGHKVEEAARILGLDEPPNPTLWIDPAARAAAEKALPPDGRPLLALSPAASAPFREWPAERFAALAWRLTAPDGPLPGARIAVLGGPADADTVAAVCEALPSEQAVGLPGDLDIPATASAFTRADLFVGNDSGLMHLAAAAGAPTLGLFGPTDERVYGPWGPKGRAVRAGASVDARDRERLRHAETSLLTDLDVATVDAAARALLADVASQKEPVHG